MKNAISILAMLMVISCGKKTTDASSGDLIGTWRTMKYEEKTGDRAYLSSQTDGINVNWLSDDAKDLVFKDDGSLNEIQTWEYNEESGMLTIHNGNLKFEFDVYFDHREYLIFENTSYKIDHKKLK